MLQLKNITKDYLAGENTVHALCGVSLSFRESEFVSILGPSGCGKTTLLNIVGGLDRYTSGDMIIGGISTKDYKDKDWDCYRNHSIGFVFQSYNLIPHQSVLKNVELALTISGIKRDERRERAKAALEKVGLGDQLNKKPNQMSGGQMQRVAIARAIVNDPDIILADEPTGALDTETSIQVMEILKELSKTRLVIMVTHNPELANTYSTRIINLKDGKVTGDTDPFAFQDEKPEPSQKKQKKPSMSFLTSLSLSFNNLATKKARTLLTSIAGSIGIIGIALILSLSSGFSSYISRVQQETLTSYPLTINRTNIDMTSMVQLMLGTDTRDEEKFPSGTTVTTQNAINDMVSSMVGSASSNDLPSFKTYLEENLDKSLVSDIKYSYNIDFKIYKQQTVSTSVSAEKTSYNQVYPVNLPSIYDVINPQYANAMESYYAVFGSLLTSQAAWGEIVGDQKLIESQYDFLAGHYPSNANEIILVVDQYNQISDLALYLMGLMTDEDISYIFNEMMLKLVPNENGEARTEEEIAAILKQMGIERSQMSYSFDDLLGLEYSAMLDAETYEESGETVNIYGAETKLFTEKSDEDLQNYIASNNTVKLKVSGIVRLKDGVTNGAISGTIGYREELTKLLLERNNAQPIVQEYYAEAEKAETRRQNNDPTAETLDMYYVNIYTGDLISETEYSALKSQNLQSGVPLNLSILDENSPSAISIYPMSFESKNKIIDFIDEYNKTVEESKQIKYSDYIGIMMSSITVIINAITYILIAFVSTSLVVSSIMIGIITYISVLERTKEIGVLRAIGASKRDVGTIFNAETIIIGLVSGLLGILITLLFNIPINLVINHFTSIGSVAKLPVVGGIILVLISVLLSMIAGLIPSRIASKKDPVIALRSE